MQNKTCFAFGGVNFFKGAKSKYLIELHQTGFDSFTVIYGLQVKTGLSYGEACAELGACIMHNQACNGRIDNRTKFEANKQGESAPYFEPFIGVA